MKNSKALSLQNASTRVSVNHDFKTEVKLKNMEGNRALNFGSIWRRLVSFDKAVRALGRIHSFMTAIITALLNPT